MNAPLTRYLVLLCLLASACASTSDDAWLPAETASLTLVAESERQWTGLAIAQDGRIFVSYPLWSNEQEFAVGELLPDGSVRPYPMAMFNDWRPGRSVAEHLICVQALLADRRPQGERLWILDPANPRFEGVVPGGPKLVVVNLISDLVQRIYRFDPSVAYSDSYLNDLCLDLDAGFAYLTDSGRGGLVVLDLHSGKSWRMLDQHPSTHAEDTVLVIDGAEWRDAAGELPRVHTDGIALSHDGTMLYYQALSGRNLYRVPTSALREPNLPAAVLAGLVEHVAVVGPSDGLLYGPDGAIYLSSLEQSAVRRVWPESGEIETVVQDTQLAWPDSFALGAEGRLHVTTAQIHRGAEPTEPYGIYRIDP